jgi:hypothetical protein
MPGRYTVRFNALRCVLILNVHVPIENLAFLTLYIVRSYLYVGFVSATTHSLLRRRL